MIYLSAVSDDYFYFWQVELLLDNFSNLGVPKEDIHILIGYNSERGLRHYFSKLIEDNFYKASFFCYPDDRASSYYLSSIRPNLIKKHICNLSKLQRCPIFYHDSDVIFRELPNFDKMLNNDIWYVSNTTNYLDSHYIIQSADENLFHEMCEVVGILEETVVKNDVNAGGAQYLIKGAGFDFWQKVEADSESLYVLLKDYNLNRSDAEYILFGKKRSEVIGIQSWCADMWAILWNAWLFNYNVKVDEELDFCSPKDPIECWKSSKILHYVGEKRKENDNSFCKGEYIHYPPYFEDFDYIDKSTCSSVVIEHILKHVQIAKKKRINLKDVTFLIPVRIDSQDRLNNLLTILRYIENNFETNIIVVESDSKSFLNSIKLPSSCKYYFIEDDDSIFHRTRINNYMIGLADTEIISIYDTDVIVPPQQVKTSIDILRKRLADFVSPYDGRFIGVDKLFKAIFNKLLDPDVLLENKGKFVIMTFRSWGGASFINKNSFINAGLENEFFKGWGPEDVERVKRMRILGYCVVRVNGPLFHLPHQRLDNSNYYDLETRVKYMTQYLQICNYNRSELLDYISKWKGDYEN